MKMLRRISIALVVLFGCHFGAVSAAPMSAFYVFGDSNVDTGNLFGALGQPGGRSSNGKLVTEYITEQFGVPLLNYAWGGATSGSTNVVGAIIPALLNTGLLKQIEGFSTALGGSPADSNGIYIVWAGSNDLVGINHSDPAAVAARVSGVVSNLTLALNQLDALGAERILVATRTPRPSLTSADNLAGVTMNAAIRSLVPTLDAALGAEIEVFDAYTLIEDMVLNPLEYGFTESSALCSASPACASSLAVASGYINWDAAHKTTRVHELLSDAMRLQVPEPASLLLVLCAMVLVGGIAQRRSPR